MSKPLEALTTSPLVRLAGPERMLGYYLRALALLYLAAGIVHWLGILSLPPTPQGSLLILSLTERVEAIVYAVLDPIAAVGLWLITSWGVVVWLMIAVSRLIIGSGFGGEGDVNMGEVIAHTIMISGYAVLWFFARRAAAAREND